MRFLQDERIELVGFDEEETKEVDLSAVPVVWRQAAQPDAHLVAAGGRIWIDPEKEGERDA